MISQALNGNDTSALPAISIIPDFQRDLVALIPHLRAFSRMLCGGRAIAEDMAQEALASAWRSRASFKPGTNLKAWLFTILRNEFYSHTRRAWRETRWDSEKGERISAPADEQNWALELSDTARALGDLPKGQREALVLIGAGGLSYEDAAAICSVPVGTMKSRVARARVALFEILDGHKPMTPRPVVHSNAGADDVLAQLTALTRSEAHGAAAHVGYCKRGTVV